MNMNNLEFLSNQIFYTGFSNDLAQALQEKLAEQQPEFQLKYEHAFGQDQVEATLHFRKSAKSELYFFNRYELQLQKGHLPNQPIKQTFYIGKENNITMKEAYNLLCGRAIYKNWTKLEKVEEGEQVRYQPGEDKYAAWMQLDFKNQDESGNYKALRFHENYSFDLEQELSRFSIKELGDEATKQQLLNSLKKGNRQAITTAEDGVVRQVFVEANPINKGLNFYEMSSKIHQAKTEKPALADEKAKSPQHNPAKEKTERKSNGKKTQKTGVRMG